MNKSSKSNGDTGAKVRLKSKLRNTTQAFEDALNVSTALKRAKYILRLYVIGSSTRSLRAVYNLKKICEENFPDDYELEVIDVYKHPEVARAEQIVAVPMLVKKLPPPLRKFVGDLSNTQKILVGLDIYKRQEGNDQLSSAH
jgi:circadian clock protein KaiB